MYFFLNIPKKEKSAIRLRYYVKSEKQTFVYSTGVSINPINWNKENRMPKVKAGGGGFELRQITNKLNKYIETLQVTINNIELENKTVTVNELKKRFDKVFKYSPISVNEFSIIYLISQYIKEKEKENKYKHRTIYKYKQTEKHLKEFIKINSIYKNIQSVNKQFVIDYIDYKRSNYKESNLTLHRRLGHLKTFLKWVKYKGIVLDETYNQVSIVRRDADHVHLSKLQVQLLSSLELNNKLDKYRDLFLIGVYSGQRFSDYSIFKKSDVFNNRIVKRQEKTEYKAYIPISIKLKELLDKWNWMLPKISIQKFNYNIKEICKIAGLDSEITKTTFIGNKKIETIKPLYNCVSSHTARRTFITLASEANVPDHVIMAICGIRDIKTLKTYKKFNPDILENYADSIF